MEKNNFYHYYGDRIRGLFIFTGVLMVATLPFFSKVLDIPVFASIIAMLVLAVLGGFMNPIQKWVIVADTFVAIAGFVAFEYYAVDTYLNVLPTDKSIVYFYWVNQIFAILFFIAVYLCIKTLRGKIVEHKE